MTRPKLPILPLPPPLRDWEERRRGADVWEAERIENQIHTAQFLIRRSAELVEELEGDFYQKVRFIQQEAEWPLIRKAASDAIHNLLTVGNEAAYILRALRAKRHRPASQ